MTQIKAGQRYYHIDKKFGIRDWTFGKGYVHQKNLREGNVYLTLEEVKKARQNLMKGVKE